MALTRTVPGWIGSTLADAGVNADSGAEPGSVNSCLLADVRKPVTLVASRPSLAVTLSQIRAIAYLSGALTGAFTTVALLAARRGAWRGGLTAGLAALTAGAVAVAAETRAVTTETDTG